MGIDPISIAVIAAGTLLSAGGQVMGQQAQAKEAKARQAQADLEAQNQKLQQVRQARIARANIVQTGENQGAGGSSAVVGGAEAATSNSERNIQYISDNQNVNHDIIADQASERNAAGLSNLGAGLASLGGTVFKNSDYIQAKAKSIFG